MPATEIRSDRRVDDDETVVTLALDLQFLQRRDAGFDVVI
jgi:hypothetical protein